MKKRTISVVAIVLAVVMLMAVCLSGCGKKAPADGKSTGPATAESLMRGFQEASEAGLKFESNMTMDLSMTMFGQTSAMKMSAAMHSESKGDISHVISDVISESDGQKEVGKTETYAVVENGAVTVYSKDSDGTWYKEPQSANIADFGEAVSKVATDKLEMTESDDEYVLSGSIDMDEVQEVFGNTFDVGELTLGEANVDMTDLAKASVVYHFDKSTRDLKSVDFDMTQMMQEMMDRAIASSIDGLTTDDFAMEDSEGFSMDAIKSMFAVDINRIIMHMDSFQFDDTLEISLPEEAKNAPERPEETWDGSDFMESRVTAEFETLEEAAEAAGFAMEAPDHIDGRAFDRVVVEDDHILKVFYRGGDGSELALCKAGLDEYDAGGDWSVIYPFVDSVIYNGTLVTFKGESADEIVHVSWQENGFNYVIVSDAPIADVDACVAEFGFTK